MAKLLITTLVGPGDQTRASIPFHMAVNGAAKNGTETAIAMAGDAADLLKPGVAETIRGVGVPPLKDLFEGVRTGGIRVFV